MNYYELGENIKKLAFAESLDERELYFTKCMEMVDNAKFCNLMKAVNAKKEEADN